MIRSRQQQAWVLLAIVLLWQVGAFIHLTTIRHEISANGKVVQSHQDHETDPSDSDHQHHDHHEGCALLASLTSPNAVVSTIEFNLSLFEAANVDQEVAPSSIILSEQGRFRLSPSHSPPYCV